MIGIVGFGFVGKAIYYGSDSVFRDRFLISDKKSIVKDQGTIGEIAAKCPIIFVCVPTPTNFETKKVDISIVEEVVAQINQQNMHNIVIIKSTVPPGTTEMLAQKYQNIHLMFCPEFLRENTYIEDYKNQENIIVGHNSPRKCVDAVKGLFKLSLTTDPFIIFTSPIIAETVKYTVNAFLSTKVSFFNEIYQFCQAKNIPYDFVRVLVATDKRVGKSHTKVPGWDESLGFGGKCLSKDICGFISSMEQSNIDPKVLRAVWEKNIEVRPKESWDWLSIEGASTNK